MAYQKLTRSVFYLMIFFFYSINTQADMLKPEVYVESKMYGHSETSSIKQIVFDNFEGSDYAGGNRSFTHNIWESGVRFKQFKLATLARYDYVLNYTGDVAELIYADKNDKQIQTNREYELYLDVLHARSYGFKFGYSLSLLPSLTMGVDVSALKLTSFMDGDITGNVLVGNDSYDGDIYLDYVYSQDKLLDRIADKPSGYGYAVDVRWGFQVNDRLSIDAQILDLFSQIKIDRAPFTTASATSNRVNLDANGKIDIKPVLTGRESYRKHTLKLPQRLSLEGRYLLTNAYELGARFDRYDDSIYTSLLFTIPFDNKQQVQTAFDFRAEALTLGWLDQYWRCAITSDQFDISKARTFGLSFSLAHHF
jgi:hypothetical protein